MFCPALLIIWGNFKQLSLENVKRGGRGFVLAESLLRISEARKQLGKNGIFLNCQSLLSVIVFLNSDN